MQTGHALGEQLLAQLAGRLDADLAHLLGVGLDGVQLLGELRRERGVGENGEPLDLLDVRRRHDARDDRDLAAGGRDPVAQPQVVVGVEEHLGDRVVGTGPALAPRSA